MANYNIKMAFQYENMIVIIFTTYYDEILMLIEDTLMLGYVFIVVM